MAQGRRSLALAAAAACACLAVLLRVQEWMQAAEDHVPGAAFLLPRSTAARPRTADGGDAEARTGGIQGPGGGGGSLADCALLVGAVAGVWLGMKMRGKLHSGTLRATRLIRHAGRKTYEMLTPMSQHLAQMMQRTPSYARPSSKVRADVLLPSGCFPTRELPPPLPRCIQEASPGGPVSTPVSCRVFTPVRTRPESSTPEAAASRVNLLKVPSALELSDEEDVSPERNSRVSSPSRRRRQYIPTPPPSFSRRPELSKPALSKLFDCLDQTGRGYLCEEDMHSVVVAVQADYQIGLKHNDCERLFAFLTEPSEGSCRDRVTRDGFVEQLYRLLRVCSCLHLDLSQLKVTFAAAFDRFDVDGNGVICCNEFAAAAKLLGLDISPEETRILHSFLAPTDTMPIQRDSIVDNRPGWQKWGAALQNSIEHMWKRSGSVELQELAGQIGEALAEPGTVKEKLDRATSTLCDCADKVAKAANLSVSTLGMSVAANYLNEGLREGKEVSLGDVGSLSPFLLFIGLTAVNMAKELDELVPKEMTENEALLYAQVFHGAGFTQAQFRRLLACGGCQWRVASPGETWVDADHRLQIIVRGSVRVQDKHSPDVCADLGPGTFLGVTQFLRGQGLWGNQRLTATEDVTYLSWESEPLAECLSHHQDMALQLKKILAEAMAANLRVLGGLRERRTGAGASDSEPEAECDFDELQAATSPIEVRTAVPPSLLAKVPDAAPTQIAAADLRVLMQQIGGRLELPKAVTDRCADRFLRFVRAGPDALSLDAVSRQVSRLQDSVRSLGGTTLAQLLAKVGAAAGSRDKMDQSTFVALAREVQTQLTEENAETLFFFMNQDGKDEVDLASFLAGEGGQDAEPLHLGWVTHLEAAFNGSRERTGLNRFCYLASGVREVLLGPGDLVEKSRRVLKSLWDGTDEMADFMEITQDYTGALCAVSALWQEVVMNGKVSLQDGLNLAPFLIFLGISGFKGARESLQKTVSDLSVLEASVYQRTFQPEGISVSEFLRLLRHGEARWERLADGEFLPREEGLPTRLSPCVIVQGSFGPAGSRTASRTQSACAGDFLGEAAFLGNGQQEDRSRVEDGALDFRAQGPAEILVWNERALQRTLLRDEALTMKVHRVVTLSLADRLLRSHKVLARAGEH